MGKMCSFGLTQQVGVCMVISDFHPTVGGTERQAQHLAVRLMERGIRVCVLTRRYVGLKRYEVINGIPVYRVPAPGPRAIASLVYTFSSLAWLAFNQHQYQIIHCHQVLSPMTIGVLAKMFWGKKLIAKIPGRGIEGGLAQINVMPLSSLRKKLLRQVDRFIYLGDDAYGELADLGLTHTAVKLPNGVDTDRFKPVSEQEQAALRGRLGLSLSDRLVVFTGRLVALKRLDILLKSWADVVRAPNTPACRLLILGQGEESESLKALAGQLGVGDSVSFLGQMKDVVDYLQVANVFVLPSASEGMSNSLLEAMACGLAIVATDVGGNRQVLEGQRCGLLVRPGSQAELTQSLLQVLCDPALADRLGRESRLIVESWYSLDLVAEQYIELYESLLS